MMEPSITPIPYSPDVEKPEKDEAEVAEGLIKEMRKVSETTYEDGGHALRSVHAKSHGILDGELEIYDGLPGILAQGLFATPGRHQVVMRLSTIPGDILDDSVSTPRGLAVKVFDVAGPRLSGSEDAATQDFVLVNGPSFAAANGKVFLANLKLLAATTDKAEGAKKVLSAVNRGVEAALEAVGGKSANLITMGGQPETHILGESFYSQVPIRYGGYIAKVGVFPISPELQALTGSKLKLGDAPNSLREAVVEFFRTHGGEWELRVQLCTDLDKMPVENASKQWDEDESPYLAVGKITAQPQTAWSEARSEAVDDGMAFSPWHGLDAHRPLGSIMRLRKRAYEMSAKFRETHNHLPVQEPRSFDPLPD